MIPTFLRPLVVIAAFAFAAIFGTMQTHAAFTTPTRSGASGGPPVDVGDALKIAAHDQVLDLSLRKMEALAAMLARVTDERSAREVLPAAERCYLELQLVALRGQMLPPPTATERPKLADRASRFIAARAALDAEMEKALNALRRLEAAVTNRLNSEPTVLAVWSRARRIAPQPRARSSSEATTEVDPAPLPEVSPAPGEPLKAA